MWAPVQRGAATHSPPADASSTPGTSEASGEIREPASSPITTATPTNAAAAIQRSPPERNSRK
ncbi:hypothetical protein GEV43_20005 [Actinomadura sp. J1-007]|uniref:hypothetical protein n=1 Tax=Actinomadura sp. J1-007 TaxID=2661913 RepID=UPI0013215B88|nr:hypothetical protein [Actinomadura sp. J1-007]MWK36102.1 hypothetical protein [Actinomadura sp. J1-007]